MYTHFYNLELTRFRRWFFKDGPRLGEIPWHDAVTDVHGVTAVLWYRKDQFQVQMFIMPGNYIIPEHTHPNVDSLELTLGGKFTLSLNGRWMESAEMTAVAEAGEENPYRGKVTWVSSDMIHGAVVGPGGGAFMSIQHWKNGVAPSCVSKDYNGIALSPEHETVNGVLVHKELTWRDAASKEESPPTWFE